MKLLERFWFHFYRITKLLESGIYAFWLRETVFQNNPTARHGTYVDPNKFTTEYSRLTLNDFRFIFYLLIILHCPTIVVFLIELMYADEESSLRIVIIGS